MASPRSGRLLPVPLNPGDSVALVSPSSPVSDSLDLQLAREVLEALGFRVKPGAHYGDRRGHLAGADAAGPHFIFEIGGTRGDRIGDSIDHNIAGREHQGAHVTLVVGLADLGDRHGDHRPGGNDHPASVIRDVTADSDPDRIADLIVARMDRVEGHRSHGSARFK